MRSWWSNTNTKSHTKNTAAFWDLKATYDYPPPRPLHKKKPCLQATSNLNLRDELMLVKTFIYALKQVKIFITFKKAINDMDKTDIKLPFHWKWLRLEVEFQLYL